jgi:8-oxo-dGTP diphosphatase
LKLLFRLAFARPQGIIEIVSTQYVYDYPRPAVTVDIVVISRDGRILLIRRKADPYGGSWALPGGFINIDETLADAAARELEEETGLRGLTMRQLRAFDKPDRDPRGRTIAVAFLAEVDACPAPAAGDDAGEAAWFPLDRLPPLAFDHDDIIAHARRALHSSG